MNVTIKYIDNEELPDLPFNKHDLGIIQLNIRGLKNKQAALSRLINNCLGTNKVDLILLCEIWSRTDQYPRIFIRSATL